MITESQYWISDLQKNVAYFHEKLGQRIWREASFAALEKRIMLTCYIVRKLAESNKISPDKYQAEINLYSYKNKGKTVDFLNSHKIGELYEIEEPVVMTKSFSYVINQIIHSFTFQFVFEGHNQIGGILFNSDRSKKKTIYLVKLKELIEAISPIAQCYIGTTIFERNKNGEMVLVSAE